MSKNSIEYIENKVRCNRELYIAYEMDNNYKDVIFDEQTGGVGAVHIEHSFDKDKGHYETNSLTAGVKDGNIVILDKEIHSEFKIKNTEGFWNNKPFEVAGNETATPNNIRDSLKHCAKKPNCKIAVLYFPFNNFSKKVFEQGLKKYNGLRGDKRQWKAFDQIICIQNDVIVYKKSHIK